MYRRLSPSANRNGTLQDLPEAPPNSICANTRCGRTKNLWLTPNDEWLCWPHYRIARRTQGQYKGRKKHYDFAVSVRGVDYPGELKRLHHEFAARALLALGDPELRRDRLSPKDRDWIRRVLADETRL